MIPASLVLSVMLIRGMSVFRVEMRSGDAVGPRLGR